MSKLQGAGLWRCAPIVRIRSRSLNYSAIDRKFGRIDVLVNNAAMLAQQSRLEDLGFERMQRIFAVNAIGPILYCTASGEADVVSPQRAGRFRDQHLVGFGPARQPRRVCRLRCVEGRPRDIHDRLRQGSRAGFG
jgi:hypothetical protein